MSVKLTILSVFPKVEIQKQVGISTHWTAHPIMETFITSNDINRVDPNETLNLLTNYQRKKDIKRLNTMKMEKELYCYEKDITRDEYIELVKLFVSRMDLCEISNEEHTFTCPLYSTNQDSCISFVPTSNNKKIAITSSGTYLICDILPDTTCEVLLSQYDDLKLVLANNMFITNCLCLSDTTLYNVLGQALRRPNSLMNIAANAYLK